MAPSVHPAADLPADLPVESKAITGTGATGVNRKLDVKLGIGGASKVTPSSRKGSPSEDVENQNKETDDDSGDYALWELFDVDTTHCVSLRDICKVLYFSGLKDVVPREAITEVLQELQEFGLGIRKSLPKTRQHFAKVCTCQEQDLAKTLASLYEDGYRKEIESLFNGGTLRYLIMRIIPSIFGLTNLWVEGYFFSQEVPEIKAVTGSFLTYVSFERNANKARRSRG